MNKSDIESTWLYHEIGRCYLEKGEYQNAKENGYKSLESASKAEDDVWQLNASVLIAQAEGNLCYRNRTVITLCCKALALIRTKITV